MAAAAGQSALIAEWSKVGRNANGWVMNTDSGVYGANYLKRGAVAMFEIGMNLPEDSIYPDTGINPLNGLNKYVIHFGQGALPPVNEFWSVTVYDLHGFTVPNPANRYTLGDRSNLKLNADGSLDIYLQRENPGADKEANWLPTPAEPSPFTPGCIRHVGLQLTVPGLCHLSKWCVEPTSQFNAGMSVYRPET